MDLISRGSIPWTPRKVAKKGETPFPGPLSPFPLLLFPKEGKGRENLGKRLREFWGIRPQNDNLRFSEDRREIFVRKFSLRPGREAKIGVLELKIIQIYLFKYFKIFSKLNLLKSFNNLFYFISYLYSLPPQK